MNKDLIVLTPDKNTQFVLRGLLSRPQAFHIQPFSYDIYVHPQRDPGVYHNAADFLRSFMNQYGHALVFLDREGSGQEGKSAKAISDEIKTNLERNGWQTRAEVIVFDPELEIWAWMNSPHLPTHLGWQNFSDLQAFVQEGGWWQANARKPRRPKEAMESALREKRIPRSSAIYEKIAATVTFRHCIDPAFLRFNTTLQNWFFE